MKASVVLAVVFGIGPSLSHGATEPVSRRGTDPAATANGTSGEPSVSSDGRFVAFGSAATNLGTNHWEAGSWQVWWRDREAGVTRLLSRRLDGTAGHGTSRTPSLADDGQRVAFESTADDLVANDDNGQPDIFVADVGTGEIRVVSVATHHSSARAGGYAPALSRDGRFVAFRSQSSDLVANDPNPTGPDVFARDLATGTTIVLSRTAAGTAALRILEAPAISADGGVVAFQAGEGSASVEMHVRRVLEPSPMVMSANVNAAVGAPVSWPRTCGRPWLSGDGRYLAYKVAITPTGAGSPRPWGVIRWHDLVSGTSAVISTNGVEDRPGIDALGDPALSSDGLRVAYLEPAAAGMGRQLRVWDSVEGTSQVVAPADGVGATLPAEPVFSGDGQRLFFLNRAFDEPAQVFEHSLTTGLTRLLSTNRVSGVAARGPSRGIRSSADGSVIVFTSLADDLAAGDFNGTYDVAARGADGTTEWISVADAQGISETVDGASMAGPRSLSETGDQIAFVTDARGLDSLDRNGTTDVYLRDLKAIGLTLISVNASGTAAGNGPSRVPSVSADGRWIAFESDASDLSGEDTNGLTDIFLRDRSTALTVCVSRVPETGVSSDGRSTNPSISADGRWVCFASTAGNLAPLDTRSGKQNLFLYSVADGSLRLVSTGLPDGAVEDSGNHREHWVSREGRWVLYSSAGVRVTAQSLLGSGVMLWDATTGRSRVAASGSGAWVLHPSASLDGAIVAFQGPQPSRTLPPQAWILDLPTGVSEVITNAERPHLSADGRWLSFQRSKGNLTPGQPTSQDSEIVVFDREMQREEVLASASGGDRLDPVISRDGRYVAFRSREADLVTDDRNGQSDLFLQDRVSGLVTALSASLTGGTGNGLTGWAGFSADGKSLLFESYAEDLVPGDFNQQKDLFLVRVESGPEGPRLLTLTRLDTGEVTVVWEARPGATYRVQVRADLGQGDWNDLPGEVIAESGSVAKADASAAGQARRFYRVVVVSGN